MNRMQCFVKFFFFFSFFTFYGALFFGICQNCTETLEVQQSNVVFLFRRRA